jgi:heterodisulfide reductase subunit A
MSRLGVFICHCGVNIAGTVDVKRVAASLAGAEDVLVSTDYIYMCSEPGQQLIRERAAEHRLDGLVVACCSPSMHETTFRKAARSSGINPYRCEIANIREHCAWVHQKEKEKATGKAEEIILAALTKVREDLMLEPIAMDVSRRVLVIGGGVAGMTAALDMADGGFDTVLVERSGELGGRVRHLSETYPHQRSARELTDALATRVAANPRITLRLGTEVGEVTGYVGNFDVTLRDSAGSGQELVGAIVVATGFDLYPLQRLAEYGAGAIPDVVDGPSFEKMLAAGDLRRPSDGRVPREVVFVKCAGSRDPDRHLPYCSRICCMYTARQARQFSRLVPGGQAYVFYMDIRTDVKGGEEYAQEGMEKERVLYLRGRVSRLYRDRDRVVVAGVDTLTGAQVEVAADLVVLATGVVPSAGAKELAERLRATADRFGFFTEAHLKLYPVESSTRGIFLAGCAQGPKDIADTASQASAAASKARALLASGRLLQEPLVARVDPGICSGCGICVAHCPYEARLMDERLGMAAVRDALCQGCGACIAACPNKACELTNLTSIQVLRMVDVLIPAPVSGGNRD